MANPYTINPSIGQSLVGLGKVIGQKYEKEQALEEEARLKEEQFKKQQVMQSELQEAMASGDENQIAAVSMKYPEISEKIQSTFKFKNDITKQNFMDSAKEIISGGDVEQILTSRVQQVQSQGGDPSDTMKELESYRANPEGYVEKVKKAYILADPEGFQDYQKVIAGKATEFEQGTGGMSGYSFNPETGDYKISEQSKKIIEDSANKKKEELENKSKGEQAKIRQGINKDFTTMIKGAVDSNKAAKNLEKLKKTSSPTDQLAAIFSFMKALDPTSVVREGEQDMARSTGGPTDKFIGAINQIKGEGGLTPEAFGNLVNTAKSISDSAIDSVSFDANSYLDSYEDTLTDGFKTLLKKRIPKKFEIESEVETVDNNQTTNTQAQSKYNIGQTATNPQTGETLTFTAQGWVKK